MSLTAEAMATSTVAPLPDLQPRLLEHRHTREDIIAYRARGGYADVGDPEQMLQAVETAGLRGRGGAAFPTHRKLRVVRGGSAAPVVIANGEEGEPASVKDRWLLRIRPHLVLDGLRLAVAMTDAVRAVIYLSDDEAEASVRAALDELAGQPFFGPAVEVRRVEHTYVAGEETAAVQAINGGPALPMDKPPRPFEEGVDLRPTVVSNVETLANLPFIQRLGAEQYRAVGTETSPGTFLLTLNGCDSVGLYEVPFGSTLREVLGYVGESSAGITGCVVGGYFAGVLNARALDLPLGYDEFAAAGSGLGCGAIALIRHQLCAVDVAAGIMAYFARENSGQCGSCFNGTAVMSGVLDGLRDFRVNQTDVERLRGWSQNLPGRGACGTLDGATNVAQTLLREFPDSVKRHLVGTCDDCKDGSRLGPNPFELSLGPLG